MGTTGTIMGTSRFLKEKNSEIQIIGAQPKDGTRIPGIRKWSEGMVPKICDFSRIDHIQYLSADEAITQTKELAKVEGIMGGMSSGGSCKVAIDTAKRINSGVIVCIVCDRGDRYLSSGLFET